jgi:hypothetical protein
VFNQKGVRAGVYAWRSAGEENTFVFNYLHERKEQIEEVFGEALEWKLLPRKKTCQICIEQSFEAYDKDTWPEIIEWFHKFIPKLEKAFKVPISEAGQKLRAHSFTSPEGDIPV